MAWAVLKALLAFAIVFVVGRWVLRPAFHAVAESRSAELFTLTVLLVSLAAGWTTAELGLSMAFGAFLAGMMLGETEFRHQVEAAIRPFRDVLLGLFFVGIGMLFDLRTLPDIWLAAVGGALVLMLGEDSPGGRPRARPRVSRRSLPGRTGLLLAVGGEFGFALLAIALTAGVIADATGQIALASVLLSIVLAPLLIRHSHAIAVRLTPAHGERLDAAPVATTGWSRDHPLRTRHHLWLRAHRAEHRKFPGRGETSPTWRSTWTLRACGRLTWPASPSITAMRRTAPCSSPWASPMPGFW